MNVETGSRDIHLPGSHFNRDGKQGVPLLVHLGDPFTSLDAPAPEDPIDETWMRLDPVPVGEPSGGYLLPITLATQVPEHVLRERRSYPWQPGAPRMPLPDPPEYLIYTLGPFKGERFVQAVRAHQHRRMSLTFASTGTLIRHRFFDVQLSLDVDLRLLRGPAWWLDWYVHPVSTGETSVLVQKSTARTA